MIGVTKEGVLLEKTAFGFENEGVLNPAAIREGDDVHLFYRAVSKGNYSSVGYCRLNEPLTVAERSDISVIFPQFDYESQGVEDSRITKIDDLYYLTYAAYDGVNALGAVATSPDLKHWDKLGIVVPAITYNEFKRLASSKNILNEKYARYDDRNAVATTTDKKVLLWDKNGVFFPRRINDKLYFLHRIKPDIQIASVSNLSDLTKEYWENYLIHFEENVVLSPKYKYDVNYIGGGCPPIETPHGGLLIYHTVHDSLAGYVYCAGAALLDLDNPHRTWHTPRSTFE